MATMRTAVAVAGYNRPRYFLPTIRALLANSRIESCDLWCFFDGGPESRQQEYHNILTEELAGAAHQPRAFRFVDRKQNMGCSASLIDVRRRLFDEECYERVFMFEDDMIVGPHYCALSERMLDWAEERFSDIGVVQVYNACWLSKEEKVCRLDETTVGNPHWWGYLMPRATWNAIRETLYEYEARFLNGPNQRHVDHKAIQNWAVAQLRDKLESVSDPAEILRGARHFPRAWSFERYFRGDFATGQDAMTVLAMTLAGLQKLITTVNRGKPIGASGLHFNEKQFHEARLDKVELDCFESDATRNSFRIHSGDQAILRPWMRADEVEAIRAVIRQRQPKRVLEFGAGGSTVTFAREPGIQEWWSCEHSPEWVNRVLSVSTDSNISIVTCPIDRILERIDQLLGLQFDMFFVDAFDRAAILKRLHAHLKSSPGFVLLHDASRKQYDDAIGCFPVRSTLTEGDGRHQGLVLLENTGD